MSDDKPNLIALDFGNPEDREIEAITNALADPWRRSTIELGITTGHLVADHGPSLAIILIAKHLGLMLKSYADPDILEEGIDTIVDEIKKEALGDDD